MKLSSYKNVFLKVDRKGIYFIWVRLKSRKAKLIQQVKVSLAKYGGMFLHNGSYNTKFIFTNTKPHIFKIPKNQFIPNTQLRCSSFSFSVQGFSNLYCFVREGRKELVISSFVD